MALTRRSLLGTVVAPMAVAGCLGDGPDSDDVDGGAVGTPTDAGDTDATPTAANETAPTATDARNTTVTVQVRTHPEYGDILVDPDGVTLYMFDQDTEGEAASSCYDSCAQSWPPLTVTGEPSAGADVSAQLTAFERDGGETQVMAGGWPLYYFADDSAPGDANGQGVGGVWWVLRPDGTPVRPATTPTEQDQTAATVQIRSHPDYGDILVGPDGLTLYMFDQDSEGEPTSTCTGSCEDAWPPLTVDGEPAKAEGVSAQLETFERDGGETQVMAGGWPLYYFANDAAPGDVNGQGVGDVWWVLGSDGEPIRPDATSTQTATPTATDDTGGGGY